MKIQYFSDLHSEKGNRLLAERIVSQCDADVLIFAGDFYNQGKSPELLQKLDSLAPCPLLFVPGNHDYYGMSRKTVDQDFTNRIYENIFILNENMVIIDDVCFLGATSWWDVKVNRDAYEGMNDLVMINDIDRAAREGAWGKSAKIFFMKTLGKRMAVKTVCISHHAPSPRSIPDTLAHRDVNQCYANDWHDMIKVFQPTLWIHGHIHQQSSDYFIGKTRVLSNPYGYANSKTNPHWQEECVVTI